MPSILLSINLTYVAKGTSLSYHNSKLYAFEAYTNLSGNNFNCVRMSISEDLGSNWRNAGCVPGSITNLSITADIISNYRYNYSSENRASRLHPPSACLQK